MSKLNILVLAAHPDDETLGCGGTIARLADEGNNIFLFTFTDGVSARGNNDKPRIKSLKRVCPILGIKDYRCADYPDNKMDTVPLLDIVKNIECLSNLWKKQFDLIFTHTPECLNIDHQIVYKATVTAFRPKKFYPQKILCYPILSSTDFNPLNCFRGNVYYNITNYILIKQQAIQVYEKELWKHPSARSGTQILHSLAVNGGEIGVTYAEKFQLVRQTL